MRVDYISLATQLGLDIRQHKVLAFVQDANPAMPIIVSRDHKIRFIHKTLCGLLGYLTDEVLTGDFDIQNLVPSVMPEVAKGHHGWMARWFEAPRVMSMAARGPIPIQRKDGGHIYALISLVPYLEEIPSSDRLMPGFERYCIAYVVPVPSEWQIWWNATHGTTANLSPGHPWDPARPHGGRIGPAVGHDELARRTAHRYE